MSEGALNRDLLINRAEAGREGKGAGRGERKGVLGVLTILCDEDASHKVSEAVGGHHRWETGGVSFHG